MKLPSIEYLASSARRTFLRFPLVLISAMVSCALMMYMIGDHSLPPEWEHLIMVCSLGIPLFFALALFAEKPHPLVHPRTHFYLAAALPLLLAGYWIWLNADLGDSRYYRFGQIVLAAHLAVAFAPFLAKGEMNGFWQLNRRIFLRFLLSAVYAGVFFGGLALALGAVDHLFDISIKGETYGRLWFFTVYVFQTWHFLGGFPEDLRVLDRDDEYPKALKVFSQYMLVPLVTLYVLILYAYMGKILLTQKWPEGWVGWLVSYAAVSGVFTLLLLHPGKLNRDSGWIAVFDRVFYTAILPLLGLLFAALFKRFGSYGITERRYFLFVLGVWLTGLALYMLFSRAKNIKIIPISLCLIALLTSVGPWGAYAVSKRDQSARLESLLQENHLLKDGKLLKASGEVGTEAVKKISSQVEYLNDHFGAASLQKWAHQNLTKKGVGGARHGRDQAPALAFMEEAGLKFMQRWDTIGKGQPIQLRSKDKGLSVTGYDRVVPFGRIFKSAAPSSDAHPDQVRLLEKGGLLEVTPEGGLRRTFPLKSLAGRLRALPPAAQENVPRDLFTLDLPGDDPRVRVVLTEAWLSAKTDGSEAFTSVQGYILIKK